MEEGQDGYDKYSGHEKGHAKLVISKRQREEVIRDFRKIPDIWKVFGSIDKIYQEELIGFCMGERGLKITYDTIFRLVMDPVKHPERLESFLSAVLAKKIKIIEILDREGIHMSGDTSFVIMDILVRTEDGEYINVEMQKIGYDFPLERTDCYTADLIMRQYNDVRKKRGGKFRYSDLSKVITIVIMEKSYGNFCIDTAHCIHHRTCVFDTGIDADGLSENYYICLDIYQKFIHTEIKDERDAWLLFLSSTGVEDILEVCELFPEFIRMYENMFELQRDVGRLMAMFSEALKIMDKNTEIYMVEMAVKERDEERNKRKEIQNKLSNTQNKLSNTQNKLSNTQNKLSNTQNKLSDTQDKLSNTQDKLNNTQNELSSTQNELNDTRNELNQRDKKIEELLKQLEELRK